MRNIAKATVLLVVATTTFLFGAWIGQYASANAARVYVNNLVLDQESIAIDAFCQIAPERSEGYQRSLIALSEEFAKAEWLNSEDANRVIGLAYARLASSYESQQRVQDADNALRVAESHLTYDISEIKQVLAIMRSDEGVCQRRREQ